MSLVEILETNPLRVFLGNLLSTELTENKFFPIDIWSFVHLISGGLLMWLLSIFKLKRKTRYISLISILVVYEIIEFFLYNTFTTLFIPETLVNVALDIIIGIVGGSLVDVTFLRKK